MGTTADKLQGILDSKADIKDAIEAKGVTVGDAKLSEYAGKIAEISGGGQEEENYDDDVIFIDYDGKVLYRYTAQEFLALEEMPVYNASHNGLTFVEWNWSLSNAKTYVSKYGYGLIGASLITSDGNSRFTINIDNENLLTVTLRNFTVTKNNGLVIDWGDGSEQQRCGSTNVNNNIIVHTYAQKGRYTITYIPDEDCNFTFTAAGYISPFGYYFMSPAQKWCDCIESIYYGRVDSANTGSFVNGQNIREVVMPLSLSSYNNTQYANMLKCLVLARGSVNVSNQAFQNAYNMKAISFPDTITSLGTSAVCNGCSRVKRIVIPQGVETIPNTAFGGCINTKKIIIPDTVKTLSNTCFKQCYKVDEIIMPDSITSLGNECFSNCYCAKTIKLSAGLTSIPQNSFSMCTSVENINIPEGVTTLGVGAFQGCYNARIITIPSTVQSIGNQCFICNYAKDSQQLDEVHIKAVTPPTLGTSVFQTSGIPHPFVIYVPQGSLSAYQTATNWSAYASYMEEEPNN